MELIKFAFLMFLTFSIEGAVSNWTVQDQPFFLLSENKKTKRDNDKSVSPPLVFGIWIVPGKSTVVSWMESLYLTLRDSVAVQSHRVAVRNKLSLYL